MIVFQFSWICITLSASKATNSKDSSNTYGTQSQYGESSLITEDKAEIVSEQEASQLSSTLTQMKSLALAISHEQESQLELIDRVKGEVERANVRQTKLDSKMKKLLK